MNRIGLALVGVALVAAVIAAGVYYVPDRITSPADQEAAANSPSVPVDSDVAPDGTVVRDARESYAPGTGEDPIAPYTPGEAPEEIAENAADMNADTNTVAQAEASIQDKPETTREALARVNDMIAASTNDIDRADETGALADIPVAAVENIGPQQASDPAFVSSVLTAETLDTDRVLALIEAAPELEDYQKDQLQTAVLTVQDQPETLDRVLSLIEVILVDLA